MKKKNPKPLLSSFSQCCGCFMIWYYLPVRTSTWIYLPANQGWQWWLGLDYSFIFLFPVLVLSPSLTHHLSRQNRSIYAVGWGSHTSRGVIASTGEIDYWNKYGVYSLHPTSQQTLRRGRIVWTPIGRHVPTHHVPPPNWGSDSYLEILPVVGKGWAMKMGQRHWSWVEAVVYHTRQDLSSK